MKKNGTERDLPTFKSGVFREKQEQNRYGASIDLNSVCKSPSVISSTKSIGLWPSLFLEFLSAPLINKVRTGLV